MTYFSNVARRFRAARKDLDFELRMFHWRGGLKAEMHDLCEYLEMERAYRRVPQPNRYGLFLMTIVAWVVLFALYAWYVATGKKPIHWGDDPLGDYHGRNE